MNILKKGHRLLISILIGILIIYLEVLASSVVFVAFKSDSPLLLTVFVSFGIVLVVWIDFLLVIMLASWVESGTEVVMFEMRKKIREFFAWFNEQ
jgi:hypothetical protein